MIKMLLFDLDDTLMNNEKKITDRTRKAILECADKGILIGYITARPPNGIEKFIMGLPVDAISFYNGATAFCNNNEILRIEIQNTLGRKLLEDFTKNYPNRQFSVKFEPYSLKKDSLWKNGKPCDDQINDVIGNYDFQRILFHNTKLNELPFENIDLNYTPSKGGLIIVTQKKACKGLAAETIASHYNIEVQDVVAFGDDVNDFSMLRVCGTGVAMKNAIYEIKSVADYITESCDENGIAKWIEKYILKENFDEK